LGLVKPGEVARRGFSFEVKVKAAQKRGGEKEESWNGGGAADHRETLQLGTRKKKRWWFLKPYLK